MKKLSTPYYLIDEQKLHENMEKLAAIRNQSGAKLLLALKCFAAWGVFDLMKPYMDGTTSSSYYEARLGYETFGKETHAYSVAYSSEDIKKVSVFSDKIIFNSLSQLEQFYPECRNVTCGIRINPGVSYSNFDLANPARTFSRLGVTAMTDIEAAMPMVSGAMIHFNCENDDVAAFEQMLAGISRKYATFLERFDWISLGGGISYTEDHFDSQQFIQILKNFSQNFGLQVYLEPGEAAVTHTTSLVTTVLDIVENNKKIAVVDASIEAHMLDLLVYRESATFQGTVSQGGFSYQIAGRSCLAADIFGEGNFQNELQIGDTIMIEDAAGYTMVKKNWFNGLQMPSVALMRTDGQIDVLQESLYTDYKKSLSTQ
ncbi:carboxynorspermidine decarboxylase [uncultured Desulfobacter sp.]|uniref:carboxynorspermidine decarboxylase n=1 Tax=uncultured Desulfobacter sp. TaxID=240139 RepID=UPI002AA67049|nr:carboxynorspermidine decarboxylase [uncultured Desulfobacter sp.]